MEDINFTDLTSKCFKLCAPPNTSPTLCSSKRWFPTWLGEQMVKSGHNSQTKPGKDHANKKSFLNILLHKIANLH